MVFSGHGGIEFVEKQIPHLDRGDPVGLTQPFRAAVPGSPETASPSGERHP
ncbi:hypothetical protein UO65_6481 [Actinokineospora spheciospongiae]|uniref:Uncharacterized protein n=1 Tax=Actinokineospora spheciospongiae TaxID=909613 RepID=W7IBQ4_9PSEU|nr:hypothetical protein UO65_6481 [Actinokineospora spheciospongiae]